MLDAFFKEISIKHRNSKGKKKESKEKSKVELLVSLTEEDCTFFTDEHGEGYVALNIGDGYKVMRIRSREFKDYLCLLLYQRGGKSPSTETINVALNLLEGKAKFDGKRIPLSVRVASKDGKIFYDLCHPDWKIVEITSDGWRIVPHSSIVFKRYPHQQPQVNPPQVGPEEFKRLEKYSPLEEGDRLIFLVHIASYLIPDFPHPIGALYGPHGSGKTTLLRLIRKLIDPSSVGILSLPHDPRETIQLLAHHYFAPFDNVSRLNEWQSNMLCRAVTGEGQSKRELYTDDDDVIYSFRRCLALNGINLTADNPDLMDRVIPYRLERIPRTERKSEKKIIEQFEQDLPYILGGLFSVISKALKIYPEVEKDLDGEELPRMADFTLWGEAIARALGYPPLEFRDQYLKKIRSINKETLEAHVIGDLILKLVEREKNTKEKKKTEDHPVARSGGWKNIRSGKEYTFVFLYVEIDLVDEWRKKSGKAHMNEVLTAFHTHIDREVGRLGGKVWMWMESSGLVLFPFDGESIPMIEAGMKLILDRTIISAEYYTYNTLITYRMAIHVGNTVYRPRGDTGTLVSGTVNFLFHLGQKFLKPGNFLVTETAAPFIPEGLADCFRPAGTFEQTKILRMRLPVH